MPRSPKPPEPEFLIDRSLGRHIVPDGLRGLGYAVHTLSSVYGEAVSQRIEDKVWLEEAGKRGWIVLCKDDAIRRNRLELEAVEKFGVKMFCLTAAGLTGELQRDRIVRHVHRIIQRARKPGPYIYGVYEKDVRLLWP